jgi:hypothetical protein
MCLWERSSEVSGVTDHESSIQGVRVEIFFLNISCGYGVILRPLGSFTKLSYNGLCLVTKEKKILHLYAVSLK